MKRSGLPTGGACDAVNHRSPHRGHLLPHSTLAGVQPRAGIIMCRTQAVKGLQVFLPLRSSHAVHDLQHHDVVNVRSNPQVTRRRRPSIAHPARRGQYPGLHHEVLSIGLSRRGRLLITHAGRRQDWLEGPIARLLRQPLQRPSESLLKLA